MPTQGPPSVPPVLAQLAALSWRVLVVVAVGAIVGLIVVKFLVIIVPLAVALMVVTLLMPLLQGLRRRGLSRPVAVLVIGAGVVLLAASVGAILVPPAIEQGANLSTYLSRGVTELKQWLTDGPLGLSPDTVDQLEARVAAFQRDTLSVVVRTGPALGIKILAAIVLTCLLSVYFLIDGDRINAGLLGLFQARHRGTVRAVAERAWLTLSAYVRGMVVMAGIDAGVIGPGLFLAHVPLALPLTLVVFVAGFVPVVGWLLATGVIGLVALASGGLAKAAFVVVGVSIFYFIEGNVLTPKIIGRAATLHPVVTVLAVIVGGILLGFAGAFLAIPVTAVLFAALGEVRRARRSPSTVEETTPSPVPL